MSQSVLSSRRGFLRTSLLGSLAVVAAPSIGRWAAAATDMLATPSTRVALMTGDNRADMAFRGMTAFQKEIARAIGNRRVIIKPNNVAIDRPLCATHADTIEGILEFLKSIGKLDNVAIAESAANGPTLEGFNNYHYTRLTGKYPVKLIDLDQQDVDILHAFDEKDFRPHAIRMSRVLLDPGNFIISAARMKTHDRVVATLSLKNIIVGAPIKDPGFRWGKDSKPGVKNDKPLTHGSGFRGINYNLFALAPRLHPHLSVIDGFEGMEGNGPVGGTAVDHRVCVVGTDWLAADRVAVELMGIDFAKVGYLNYCWDAKLGEADLQRIQIVGEPLANHIKTYKLSNNVEQQLIWMKKVQEG